MARTKKTPLQVKQQKVAAINAKQVWFKDVTNWAAIFPEQLNKAGNRDMKNWFNDRNRSKQNNAMGKGSSTYINRCALAFDIETYTVPESGHAYMYVWQFLINETVVMGRTWQEFIQLLNIIKHYLMLGPVIDKKGRCVEYECKCWIANINFEFGFIKHYLDIERIFAKSASDLLSVATRHGIIFQEALVLAGVTSLKKIPKVYGTPTKKMVGDLDYTKPRNSQTTLTDKELQYCINDVVILGEFWNYLLATYIDQDCDMPMTRTGVLRNHVKWCCKKWVTEPKSYVQRVERMMAIVRLIPTTYKQYIELMEYLFRGGYTHANYAEAGFTHEDEDINGYDYTSSYPAVMLQELYPVTEFKPITFNRIEDIVDYISTPIGNRLRNGVYGKFIFRNVVARTTHSLESFSKTYEYKECNKSISTYTDRYNAVIDNGRIRATDQLTVMLTDQDLLSYMEYYDFDPDVTIIETYTALFAPLPDYVLDGLITAYNVKATIKKTDPNHDSNPEYTMAKGTVNSGYGMTVQKINLEEFFFDGYEITKDTIAPEDIETVYRETVFGSNWDEILAQKEDPTAHYIKHPSAPKTFLSPFWGIWVTAYARRNLLSCLINFNEDALYCDTDSIYSKHITKYKEFVAKYNVRAREKNKVWIDEYNTKHNFDRAHYDTLTDDEKAEYLEKTGGILFEYFEDLGEFDLVNKAGNYTKFKMLGAKRYMKTGPHKEDTGEIVIQTEQTVAGLPKGAIVKHAEKLGADPYEIFNDDMCIPDCKNGHQYNEDPHDDLIIDEEGHAEMMHEESSVGIFSIDFSMSLTSDYMELLKDTIDEQKRVNFITRERID